MLDVLRDKITVANMQNTCAAPNRLRHSAGMTPIQLDLMIDPLPTERFQLIYTLMTLHHIPDTERMLRAFYDLLDPSGYLCVADLDKEDGDFHEDEFHGHLGFDRDALSAQAKLAGFQRIHFTTVFRMIKDVQGISKEFPLFLMVAEKP
jgi:SAM-dependent methyltransferase